MGPGYAIHNSGDLVSSNLVATKKILIAEDDVVSRRMLEVVIAKWGYQSVTASNGAEAWQILEKENSPRLALLDWMMPGLDGVQICRRVRRRTNCPYVYILLLSARSHKRDILEALKSGADDYITKPFDSDELNARLQVGQRIVQLQDDLIAAREALRFQATHDALTNLANRAEILSALRSEVARCQRQGGSFAVVMADLDHFKNVNDSHGHAAGDAVLKETAKRILSNVRAYDTVGRYGGEEFVIIAPLSEEAGIVALAERIRRVIESQPIQAGEVSVNITVSIGAAISTPEHPLDPDSVMRIADAALYRAKDRGRNRVELAAPLVETAPTNSSSS